MLNTYVSICIKVVLVVVTNNPPNFSVLTLFLAHVIVQGGTPGSSLQCSLSRLQVFSHAMALLCGTCDLRVARLSCNKMEKGKKYGTR